MLRQFICSVAALLGSVCAVYPQTASHPASNQGDPVVVVNGSRVITQSDVDSAAGRDLYILQERIYELRRKALDGLIDKILLEQEANARGITVEELKGRLMGEVRVSDADVDREYTEHGSSIALSRGTHGIDDTKRAIKEDLLNQARQRKYHAALAELRSKARIDLISGGLQPPLVSVSDSGPSKGPKAAPITIVEFSDFQCPFCKQSQAVLDQLFNTYPDKIRLVFKQLPGPAHPDALAAAKASICADAQGKFWVYHNKLFASEDLSRSALIGYAREVQLNTEQFEKCMDSEAIRQSVLADEREAKSIDAHATPTFVVNGRVLSGFTELAAFEQQIDLQLGGLGYKEH